MIYIYQTQSGLIQSNKPVAASSLDNDRNVYYYLRFEDGTDVKLL